jgi:pyrimidine precursor biosynthesis enzyme
MRAVKKAADDVQRDPAGSWAAYKDYKKTMVCQRLFLACLSSLLTFFPTQRTPLNDAIFERCFNFLSIDLKNVPRDWQRVTNYAVRLGLVDKDFKPNYDNRFISWKHEDEPVSPAENQKLLAAKQEDIRVNGGVLAVAVKA